MRFKFPCSCGKRLAAYSWMVGKIVECPKCRKTLTIPTPERAAQMRNSSGGDTLVSPYRGPESSWTSPVRSWVWVAAVVAVLAGAAFLAYAYWIRPH